METNRDSYDPIDNRHTTERFYENKTATLSNQERLFKTIRIHLNPNEILTKLK